MGRAEEIIRQAIPSEADLIGKVSIAIDFESISPLTGAMGEDILEETYAELDKRKEVFMQYRSIREKIGGWLFGFYINPAVRKQNELNLKYKEFADEYRELCKERAELVDRVNNLQVEIMRCKQEKS